MADIMKIIFSIIISVITAIAVILGIRMIIYNSIQYQFRNFIPKFKNGSFSGDYEQSLIEKFDAGLPEYNL